MIFDYYTSVGCWPKPTNSHAKRKSLSRAEKLLREHGFLIHQCRYLTKTNRNTTVEDFELLRIDTELMTVEKLRRGLRGYPEKYNLSSLRAELKKEFPDKKTALNRASSIRIGI